MFPCIGLLLSQSGNSKYFIIMSLQDASAKCYSGLLCCAVIQGVRAILSTP